MIQKFKFQLFRLPSLAKTAQVDKLDCVTKLIHIIPLQDPKMLKNQ